jgi:riboflavin kinase/FMN adenylyltransferase
MQILNSFTEKEKQEIPLALALGNFDGVHRGHQLLLQKCREESEANSWASAVLLWDPHPAKVLRHDDELKFINTCSQKNKLIEALGLQYLFCLPFDQKTAALSPEGFVSRYLIDLFRVKKVFVGFNYSFGRNGAGTPELLQMLGEKRGFAVSVIAPVTIDGEIVSSSLIRQKLLAGDIPAAAKLLGYAPILEGNVVPGKHRGTGLGFPTANIAIPAEQLLPSYGVYAAFAEYQDEQYPAILNIGMKPTFNGNQVTVEVHIPGLHTNLYNQFLRTRLIKKIRDEQKFPSKEALSSQISCDLAASRRILQEYGDFMK